MRWARRPDSVCCWPARPSSPTAPTSSGGAFLPDIVTGRKAWCQLFSEPGAGSDLAGLQAQAVRDGDEWIVNGQKVWTSGAQWADIGMLLARTDADVPKHAGISYFGIEMDQPGMDIRPLREMTGRALFNEVFMTDVRVADAALLGGLNNGWAVANTTLANERAGLGAGGGGAAGTARARDRRPASSTSGPATASADGRSGTSGALAGRGGRDAWSSWPRAWACPATPTSARTSCACYTLNEIARYTNLRIKAAKAAGRGTGAGGQHGQAVDEPHHPAVARPRAWPSSAPAACCRADAPLNGMITEMALFSPAVSIYGGSDEIQQQHHRRAGAGPAQRASARQGCAVQGPQGRHPGLIVRGRARPGPRGRCPVRRAACPG